MGKKRTRKKKRGVETSDRHGSATKKKKKSWERRKTSEASGWHGHPHFHHHHHHPLEKNTRAHKHNTQNEPSKFTIEKRGKRKEEAGSEREKKIVRVEE